MNMLRILKKRCVGSSLGIKYAWELNIFHQIRKFNDGVIFLRFEVVSDLYKADHNPRFCVILEFLNFILFEFTVYNRHHQLMDILGHPNKDVQSAVLCDAPNQCCGNCCNMENCSKHLWMRCKNLEGWVPVLSKDALNEKKNTEAPDGTCQCKESKLSKHGLMPGVVFDGVQEKCSECGLPCRNLL